MSDDKRPIPLHGWLLVTTERFKSPPEILAALATGWVFIASALLIALGIAATIALAWLIYHLCATIWPPAGAAEEVRNTLIAIGALVGAPFLVWRTWVAHVAARANDEQAKIARESLYTSLFTKAVEQLGATREVKETKIVEGEEKTVSRTEPNIEVRLGAIYALERIAQDSERDHWPIMETLCAYIRNNAGAPVFVPSDIDKALDEAANVRPLLGKDLRVWVRELAPPRADVQAALTVIGRRSIFRIKFERQKDQENPKQLAYRIDLSNTNLNKANLRGLNFDGAALDNTSLAGAQLEHARFFGCSFVDSCLAVAAMSGSTAVHARFVGADLRLANLWEADFASSSFLSSRLRGIRAYSAKFDGARFNDSDLTNSVMRRSSFNFSRFTEVIFHQTDMGFSSVSEVEFDDCKFNGVIGLVLSQLSNIAIRGAERPTEDFPQIDPKRWTVLKDGDLSKYDISEARQKHRVAREFERNRADIYILESEPNT